MTYRFNKFLKFVYVTQISDHAIFDFNWRIDFDDLIIVVPNVIGHRFEAPFLGHKTKVYEGCW